MKMYIYYVIYVHENMYVVRNICKWNYMCIMQNIYMKMYTCHVIYSQGYINELCHIFTQMYTGRYTCIM